MANSSDLANPFNITHPSNLMLSIVSGTIGAVGIPGNCFLMALIASEYKKRKPHEWILFMLALGDLILCMNNAFLEAPFVLNFSSVWCTVAGGIDYIFGIMSFMTPPVVAYNRYLSLYDNPRCVKIFTTRRVFAGWLVIALYTSSFIAPFAITGSLGQDDLGVCGTQMKNIFLKIVFSGVEVTVFTSYIVLAYYSYMVVMKIRNHRKSKAVRSRLINESEEIITTMLIISVIPFFAQVPAAVIKGLDIILPPFTFSPWIGRLAIAPFPLTSSSNAYITIYVVKDYRKKVLRIFNRTVAPTTMEGDATTNARIRETRRSSRVIPLTPSDGCRVEAQITK